MKKYILNPISLFFIGVILGIISKLLDILFVGNLFMMTLGYMFSDLPIWVLLGTLISIYSDTRKKSNDKYISILYRNANFILCNSRINKCSI